jgi:hypothetical protein
MEVGMKHLDAYGGAIITIPTVDIQIPASYFSDGKDPLPVIEYLKKYDWATIAYILNQYKIKPVILPVKDLVVNDLYTDHSLPQETLLAIRRVVNDAIKKQPIVANKLKVYEKVDRFLNVSTAENNS